MNNKLFLIILGTGCIVLPERNSIKSGDYHVHSLEQQYQESTGNGWTEQEATACAPVFQRINLSDKIRIEKDEYPKVTELDSSNDELFKVSDLECEIPVTPSVGFPRPNELDCWARRPFDLVWNENEEEVSVPAEMLISLSLDQDEERELIGDLAYSIDYIGDVEPTTFSPSCAVWLSFSLEPLDE